MKISGILKFYAVSDYKRVHYNNFSALISALHYRFSFISKVFFYSMYTFIN